jgi:hypothetical protein
MTRKHRSDSTKGLLAAYAEQEKGYLVPEGLIPLTEREQLAWCQYCLARGSWKEAELRILHRAIRLETELEQLQEEASATPTIYEKPSGDLAEHPIHGCVRNKFKTLQSELRMVGLQCSPDRKAGVGNSGRFVAPSQSGVPSKLRSLLAQPVD